MMFNLPARTGATILPASGNVGAQYTPAAGWAQAIQYRTGVLGEADWAGAIAVACGGEGSTAANGFWAALNIASTLKLPMIFFIENNCYGLSVPADLQTPGGNVAANLACYASLKILEGDGTDPQQTADLIRTAVDHVRSGLGPCLLQLYVVRLTGHTFIDDQSYKPEAEKAEEAQRDPLLQLKSFLDDDARWDELETEIQRELQAALSEAEALPEPNPADVRRHLFFEGETPTRGGLRPDSFQIPPGRGFASA